ncbi:MAG: cyclic nucleotide-binding domain-containing protein [Planctomycetota bacterium]
MKSIAEVLDELPFTAGMQPAHRELIAGCGRNVAYPEGAYLFREGQEANTFWILRGGQVALEVYAPHKGALVIETLGADEVLGWSWIFPPYRYAFDARATAHVRAIAFDGACLRGKAEADHELGYELMRRVAGVFTRRLTAARWQLLDIYGHPARG